MYDPTDRRARRSRLHLAACSLVALGVLLGPAHGRSPDDLATIGGWPLTSEGRVEIGLALRELRSRDAAPVEELAQAIAEAAREEVPHLLEILASRVVPEIPEQDLESQRLSLPQRELLLATIALLPEEDVRATLARFLGRDTSSDRRRATLYALAAIGGPGDVTWLFELALDADEEQPERRVEEAFEEALARILTREPAALGRLDAATRRAPEPLLAGVLRALGRAGRADGLEVLADVMFSRRELIPLGVAQIRLIGRSPAFDVNEDIAYRLRPYLDAHEPNLCRAATLALGELGDHEAIPQLVDLLDEPHEGLQGTAHWALTELTGFEFPARADIWRVWYRSELEWLEDESREAIASLHSPDPRAVSRAMRSISRHRLDRDRLALEVAGVLYSHSERLRRLACLTLAELDSPTAVPDLIESLNDPDASVRSAAWESLRQLTGQDLPPDADAWWKFAQASSRHG